VATEGWQVSIDVDGRSARTEDGGPDGSEAAPDGQDPTELPRAGAADGASSWRAWQLPYALALLTFDAASLAIAAVVCDLVDLDKGQQLALRFAYRPYSLVSLALIPVWIGVVAASGGYARRRIGNGSEEYRAVLVAGVRTFGLLSAFVVLNEIVVSRRFLVGFLLLGTTLMVFDRYLARRWLHAQRLRGRALQSVVVVGTGRSVADLVRHLRRNTYAGLAVVGACLPEGVHELDVDGTAVPVVGTTTDLVSALEATGATAVAVTGAAELGPGGLRSVAWALEGTGVDLIVAPELTDIAGPRISVRPLSGLPLLAIEEPRLSGPARVLKDVIDRVLAVLLLVLLSPLLLAIAVGVRTSSPGPVFFRQERVGRDGRSFQMIKFRTMVQSAETDLAGLLDQNQHGEDGPLFKMRDDPRITRFGGRLRRYSVDELPQLWHVLTGRMSLVGPRPPLPREVAAYGADVRRRLLVKPGMTGLWQVSGRADLAWDEAVRLDLYYVDSWSPALDLVILWKTVNAVLRGRGAY
jgi:exopolysaccharide biosynthesis polyprenyl glycosylphosphotransferase